MGRKAARKHSFMIIYQMPFHSEFELKELFENYISQAEEKIDEADRDFILMQTNGVYSNLDSIDEIISENLVNWSFDRLSKIDMAILRLAVFELKSMPQIPSAVSINEALNLAEIFGEDKSKSFINGILATAVKQLRGNENEA